jgi:hypothetical protein
MHFHVSIPVLKPKWGSRKFGFDSQAKAFQKVSDSFRRFALRWATLQFLLRQEELPSQLSGTGCPLRPPLLRTCL